MKDIIPIPNTILSRELLDLREAQQKLRANARAASTRKAYETDWRLFCEWVKARTNGDPLLATQTTISMYLTWMVQTPYLVGKAQKPKPRKAAAIARAATGILFMRRKLGKPVSRQEDDEIAETLSAVRRTLKVTQRKAKPLLGEHLPVIASAYGSSIRDVRDLAIILLGWYSASRQSEIVGLDVSDIQFEPAGMVVTIRTSKTDQEGETYSKGIKYAKSQSVCAVRALKRWLELSNITEGPLFRGFTRMGELRNSRLTSQIVADIVQNACTRIGLDAVLYGGHSLRSGFMTTGARKGLRVEQLMHQSGHKTPRMAMEYVRRAELLGDENPTGELVDG